MQEVYNQQRVKEEPSSVIQTGGREVEGKKRRGPASQVARGMPRRARTEREASICFSGDVGHASSLQRGELASEQPVIPRKERQEGN